MMLRHEARVSHQHCDSQSIGSSRPHFTSSSALSQQPSSPRLSFSPALTTTPDTRLCGYEDALPTPPGPSHPSIHPSFHPATLSHATARLASSLSAPIHTPCRVASAEACSETSHPPVIMLGANQFQIFLSLWPRISALLDSQLAAMALSFL